MNLEFFQASKDHIPVIFRQAKELIETYEDLTTIDLEKVLTWMEHKIALNISAYTAVTAMGKTCAFYHLCEGGELDDLYVLSEFQNRGIGSAIMEKCIAESENPIYLYVFSRNHRAISFYKRFGFSIREKVGQTRLIMARKG